MDRKCENCEYCVLPDKDEQPISDFGNANCYRYPPASSNMQDSTGTESELYLRPTIHSKFDWCGEFTPRNPEATSIYDIDWSARVRNVLDRLKITTIEQLGNLLEVKLLQCRNFGKTSLNEVRRKLHYWRQEQKGHQ